MTNTYNTLNPLGSVSAKDLSDNASNFDEAMNSESPSFYDRFLKRRETWAGMEKMVSDFLEAMGFEATHLVYVDGTPLTVLRPTQLIDRAGSVYKVKMPATFPVNLTGTWATDQILLVDVGDAALRADLANATDPSKGAAMVGRSCASVESVDALLDAAQVSSQTVLVKGFLPATIVGGGAFRWNSGRLKSAHNGGTVISPTVPWDGTTGAALSDFLDGTGETSPSGSGCWERLGVTGRVDPEWFGAVGDYDFGTFSGTDNVVPFQHAAEALKAKGGILEIGSGRFYLSDQVEFNLPIATDDFYRVSVIGNGSAASELVIGGTVGLRFTGGTVAGVHSYQNVERIGMRAVGGIRVHTAIAGDNLSYMTFDRLRIENFEYAFNLTDILSSTWRDSVIRGNRIGINAARTNFSHPNAISIENSYFTANSALAVILGSPSVFNISGGSVEGNGFDTGETARGGIRMIDPGAEGSNGICSTGVYYEGNAGTADFYSSSTGSGGQVSFSFQGNSFNRLDSVLYTTNNVRIDGQSKFSVSLSGNGFKEFLSYSPNSARKYVQVNPSAAADAEILDGGNFYSSAIEAPVFPGRFVGRKSSAAAYVRFDGSGGGASITDSYNALSVTRIGVGTYRFAYAGLMPNVVNTYSWCKTGPGFAYPISETTAYVDFVFTDIAGAPHDVSGCQITVHGA